MDKSNVSIACTVCPVCNKQSDTNEILLDTRMRDVLHMRTSVGWLLCEEHQKIANEGHVFLVGVTDQSEETGVPELIGETMQLTKTLWVKLASEAPESDVLFVPLSFLNELKRVLGANACK